MTDVSDNDLREAIDRIARTPDGEMLYLYFQRVLCEIPTGIGRRPLTEHHGRRSFAAQLMGLMAEGIGQSGSTGNRPVVFSVRERKRVDGHVSRRRVTADTVVAGWNDAASVGPNDRD